MERPAEISKKNKIIFTIIIFVAVPFIIFFLGEISGRVVVSVLYGHPGKSYGIYDGDPVLGHIPAPDTYNHLTALNDHGFRNLEDVIDPKPEGALRVIIYGGSPTFAYNLPTEETWPYKLQLRLRGNLGNPAHQVLNAGVVLWSLSHAYERARREIPLFKPDYVLIYSGFNEESNAVYLERSGKTIKALVEEGRYGVIATNYPASAWLHRNSLVFKAFGKFVMPRVRTLLSGGGTEPLPFQKRLLRAGGEGSDLNTVTEPDSYVLKNYLEVLEKFVGLARRHGAEPVFIVQASANPPPKDRRLTAYSARGARFIRTLGVRVLSAWDVIGRYGGPPMDLFFHTGIHFSAKGSDAMADYLFEQIFRNRDQP